MPRVAHLRGSGVCHRNVIGLAASVFVTHPSGRSILENLRARYDLVIEPNVLFNLSRGKSGIRLPGGGRE